MADPICVFNSVNLAFGFSSLFVGILAGAVSIYFFKQGKETETEARIALAEIKTQVSALETISNTHLEKLIDRATTIDPSINLLVSTLLGDGNNSNETDTPGYNGDNITSNMNLLADVINGGLRSIGISY